jgi:sulfonate transport system ATP-binding protein
MTAIGVHVSNLTRAFGANTVLDRLSLDLEPGGFVALLGRSGSGKTTLLRTLAGLDPAPKNASIVLPTPTSVVFQEPRLLPWKRVWRNVALGLPGGDARDRASAALGEVGLQRHLDAWPITLSGGEAQRVALARALARRPDLLLLDEPSAALDAATRDAVLTQLIEAIGAAAIPALAATHDPTIAALADWLVLLSNGAVIRQGRPRDLFNDPQTEEAARLLGYQNFWTENGVRHTIRAEDITLAAQGRPAKVTGLRDQGFYTRLTCAAPEPWLVLIRDDDAAGYELGQIIQLYLPGNAIKTLSG